MANQGSSTLCVHAGNWGDSEFKGAVNPIYPSTVYDYRDVPELRYPRYQNTPNQRAVVEKLCALESAEAGLLFSSGMAAISATLLTLLAEGDTLLVTNGLYGGTQHLIENEFPLRRISATAVPCDDDALLAAMDAEVKVLMLESPTNPLMDVIDLEKIAAKAKARGIVTVIDNTFATPINQQPLTYGFDVVVHSGTKYLGGHSDLICGVSLTSEEIAGRIWNSSIRLGGSVNAQTAYQLERSLKTLELRVSRHNENAVHVAQFLEGDPRIAKVNYPGLPSHPNHAVAQRQMAGFGGMLSFEISTSAVAVTDFLERLGVITPGMSLGGVESTICEPTLTSHAKISAEERQRQGIADGLLRLSVGIENKADLLADLDQALAG